MVRVMDLDTCPTELLLERFVSQTSAGGGASEPATVEVGPFGGGSFGGDEATRIETHLSQCEACRRRVDSLRRDASLLVECRHVIDDARSTSLGPIGAPATGGASLGHFTLVEEIGAGGQGVVWRAIDRRTKRPVAMKVLRLGQFAPARHRQRLEREIDIVAALRHPGIVTLYETVDLPSDGKALVMELIEGVPFDIWCANVRDGNSPGNAERLILGTLAEACDALHHAHLRGVIHRDMKPSNILVDGEGHPHLVDFGIAKAAFGEGAAHAAITTEPIGSPAYMAPEQAVEGGDPDLRADLYSIGAIAFEALTGARPFPGRRHVGDIAATSSEDLRPPQASARLAPGTTCRRADLDAVIATALAADPRRRYASASDLASDLRALRDNGPVLARRESLGYHLRWLLRKHRRALAASLVAAALAITSISVWLVTSWMHEARQQRLVDWGDSLSSLLAEAELDFPDGSIGKDAAIRLDEQRVADAVAKLDELFASGSLKPAEEAKLSLALARVCYIAGSSLERAEGAAKRALEIAEREATPSPAERWEAGELLGAIRLRRTNGESGFAELSTLATALLADPASDEPLKAHIRERISNFPIRQSIEELSGTLEELERQIRAAEEQ